MAMRAGHRYAEVGARIRSAREQTGLSQERFAPLISVTRRHLIRLENGEHLASPELRERIAKHTGVPADQFGLDEDDEEADPVADLFRALERFIDHRVGVRTFP